MDRPRQILKWIALGLALLVVSTALARRIIPYRPRTEVKPPPHSHIYGFSPDGQTLYTACFGDGPICAWDLQTGQERFRVASDWKDMRIALSADGRYLGASQKEAGLMIWDARTGQEIDFLKLVHRGSSVEFCFSPDGELLLLQDYRGDEFESWRVLLWHIRDRREIGTIEEASIGQLSMSADGQKLVARAVTNGQARVRLWQLTPDSPPTLLAEHLWCADSMTLSPDLTCLATVLNSEDQCELSLWDLTQGTLRDSVTLKQPGPDRFSVEFSGNDLLIATHWSIPETFRVIQVTPQLREAGSFPGPLKRSPDGNLIAAWVKTGAALHEANSLAKLGDMINPGDQQPLMVTMERYPWITFSPDSRLVLVDGLWALDTNPRRPAWVHELQFYEHAHWVIRMWDARTCREVVELEHCKDPRFTPDGKTLVTWYDELFQNRDNIIQVWDYPLRQPLLLTAFCCAMFWLLMALPIAFVRKLRQ